jgi:hypothetical protein
MTMASEITRTWHLGNDKYGRRVTLTVKPPHQWVLEVEPANQRDDGYIVHDLSRDLLIEAGKVAEAYRP